MNKSALLRLKLSVQTFRAWSFISGNTSSLKPLQGINTRKLKGLDSSEITSLSEIKKVIYMARHFNHHRK